VLGRLFEPGEGRAGSDDRVLLSEDVWRSAFGADPAIVGRRVAVDGEPLIVIGVLPSDFRFPAWDTELWRPIDYDALPPALAASRPAVYVRLSRRMPREEMLRLAAETAHIADPRTARMKPQFRLLLDIPLDPYASRAVPVLAGAVLLVFFILCANVCSLLLARLTARRGEFSMRAALGASRARLMRQALAESAMLGLLGVLAGVGIGWVLVSLARTYLPDAFLLRTLNPLSIDVRALLATSCAGIVGTIAAGLLPAWLGTRVNAGESLRIVDRSGTEARGPRLLMRGLLVLEVALACTLLVGTTLLVRSFVNLQRAERGLDSSGVVVASVYLRGSGITDLKGLMATARTLVEDAVRGMPGVRQLAWSVGGPPSGGLLWSGDFLPDRAGAAPVWMEVEHRYVGPDFFGLYGIPVLRGRSFEPGDTGQDVIVGERVATALWPGQDPVDRTFAYQSRQYRVIGLARETRYPAIDAGLDRPEIYSAYAAMFSSHVTLNIRCETDCPSPAFLQQRIASVHPNVAASWARVLDDVYLEQLARPRAAAALALAFAGIAVLAAAGGLFSVLSYAVGRRRREFGIRTALGASPAQLRRIVLREGLMVAMAGIALGSLAALPLTRVVESMQYGMTMSDPVSWAIVLTLLATTTLAAAWRPARAAARMDPVVLLRQE
jgi:putative ABC transport system permease protein